MSYLYLIHVPHVLWVLTLLDCRLRHWTTEETFCLSCLNRCASRLGASGANEHQWIHVSCYMQPGLLMFVGLSLHDPWLGHQGRGWQPYVAGRKWGSWSNLAWCNDMIDIFIDMQCWPNADASADRPENFDARPCSICCKSCWQLRMGHWESPIHIGHIATLAREKRLRATWATWWDGMIGMAKQPVTVPPMEPFIKVIKGQLGSCRVYFMLRENRESEFGPSWSFKF